MQGNWVDLRFTPYANRWCGSIGSVPHCLSLVLQWTGASKQMWIVLSNGPNWVENVRAYNALGPDLPVVGTLHAWPLPYDAILLNFSNLGPVMKITWWYKTYNRVPIEVDLPEHLQYGLGSRKLFLALRCLGHKLTILMNGFELPAILLPIYIGSWSPLTFAIRVGSRTVQSVRITPVATEIPGRRCLSCPVYMTTFRKMFDCPHCGSYHCSEHCRI